jgi:hypothetical protein
MRIWLSLVISVVVAHCARGQLEPLLPELQPGVDTGRVFVSTNRHHMPYYLVNKDLDLPSKLGSKWATNDLAGASYTTDSMQLGGRVNGKVVFWDYSCKSGRYAFIAGTRLTLVDFKLVISEDVKTRGELVLVNCSSKSFRASPSLLEEIDRLKQTTVRPKYGTYRRHNDK